MPASVLGFVSASLSASACLSVSDCHCFSLVVLSCRNLSRWLADSDWLSVGLVVSFLAFSSDSFVCLSVCLCFCLSVCLSVGLSAVCPPVRLSGRLPVSLSVCPPVCLSACPSVSRPVCFSVSVCLSVSLFVCLSVHCFILPCLVVASLLLSCRVDRQSGGTEEQEHGERGKE